jgi:dTDP-4-dehydrorhamnose reductase
MKAIITGTNGTVAPVIARTLTRAGWRVVAWDRQVTPPEDEAASRAFILEHRPDWFLHVATGSPDWAGLAAETCALHGISFLFTSSVSVFDGSQQGPFPVTAEPRATDDYGRYKLEVERRVATALSSALIARLGWQIGSEPHGNTMLTHLHRTATTQGFVEASTRWVPSCAYLEDTAAAIHALIDANASGLYQLEGNPGLNFFEIVTRLNDHHGFGWDVRATENHVQDNRMIDPRVNVRRIDDHWRSS